MSHPQPQPAPAAELPTPGLLTLDQLRHDVHDGSVRTIELALPDLLGRLKGKRYEATRFLQSTLKEGADMCAYLLAADADMTPLPGCTLAGWDTGYHDLRAMPDLTAIRRTPCQPDTVLIHADALSHDGQPIDIAPRQMLRKQLQHLAHLGYTARVGIETEFVLYEGTARQAHHSGYNDLTPVTWHNGDYSLDHTPRLTSFFNHLQDAMRSTGTPVEAVKTEGAPGQIEVTFPYGDPMAAADNHTLFKRTVRYLSDIHDYLPTFMAAPQDGTGSGCHLHISLWHNDNPAFAHAAGKPLPRVLDHTIAGLLTHLPDLAPLFAPRPNSYLRYTPHSFAPTNSTWGHDNRTCAIRVTGTGPRTHLEIRLPGADTNPYLALTAALAAMATGITDGIPSPGPCSGDAYHHHDAPPLPRDLAQALDAFRTSPLATQALGPDVVQHYIHAAQHELDITQQRADHNDRERWLLRA